LLNLADHSNRFALHQSRSLGQALPVPRRRFEVDLTDSASQSLKHLRDVDLAESDEEEQHAEMGTVMHRPGCARCILARPYAGIQRHANASTANNVQ
jgi:hypothetical protein